jgi:hypothetical protein
MSCPWLQRRLYRCSYCGRSFLHDKMFHHAQFICTKRPSASKASTRDARDNMKEHMR